MSPAPRLPAVRALLFDFDHTLADLGSHVRWGDARRELLAWYEQRGVPREELGSGTVSLYARVAASGLLPEGALEATLRGAAKILGRYEGEAIPTTRLLPGVREALRTLEGSGRHAGVVSSNSREVVRAILEGERVADRFGAIVGREDVRLPKPAPEGLLLACERLGVLPGEAVYAGDNVADIEAARAAGMPACGVRGGDSSEEALREAGAVAILDGIEPLVSAVLRAASPERVA
ncbi:MAG: HAD family hydrolase [Chloroflexi bacterium]|nr:HAD family hydrolase [Chloroflexota bacterium]